jgi:hypothetical protein
MMPEIPVFGDRRGVQTPANAQSQALEFRAKMDAV